MDADGVLRDDHHGRGAVYRVVETREKVNSRQPTVNRGAERRSHSINHKKEAAARMGCRFLLPGLISSYTAAAPNVTVT